ncbi:threonine deaminase [Friedmanniomyces endolithicus]|nr:threonine deaminase [Friedmanniomyces endolithicus]
MPDAALPNGLHTPETPKPSFASLALTEYSANPSPPSSTPKEKTRDAGVPEEFLLPTGYPDYLRLILTAKVYDVVETTPLTHAINLSNRLESHVLLKREDLQPVFSFKLRGAYNKMAHLTDAERWKGVIACSAGNHAQGVAYSARKLKIPATITMPIGTPAIKHTNVTRMGGNVVLHGADFDAAKSECARLATYHGLTNIPPFDDPYVIAGQGTIGAEILRQADLSKLEAIFCCVGGGGLIAGIGVYVKRIAPLVKIIGVETYDANALVQSLKAAGLKKYVERNPDENTRRQLVAIASGANMNFDRLRFVAERAAIGEKKEAILAVSIPERPGAFARLVAAVNPNAVTEFCYRYSSPTHADVLIGIQMSASTRTRDLVNLIHRLDQDGMRAIDLSGDELAKSHIRYLVGGRSDAANERLFAFEFPERQGALYKFLTTLQPGFNISLFHYRNYGGDVGKVLAGIQCPPGEEAELEKFLQEIGYGYKEETENETYKMFMRA